MNPSIILVAEDEAIVAMDIQNRLTAMGYQSAGCAASGEEVLALVDEKRPHLVLMDIRLQGDMDGIEAAEVIRRQFHVPVVFLTAYSEEATLQRAKLAEPFGYILKPFNNRELKSTIEIALYKHGAEEEIRRLTLLMDVLSQVNQAIVRSRSRDALVSSVCRVVVERGAMELAWIGWIDPDTSQIDPVAWFGDPNRISSEADFFTGCRVEGESNFIGTILDGKPFVANECKKFTPSIEKSVPYDYESCASFPLRSEGRVLGALSLCVAEPEFFREREIELVKEIALDVSFALDKIESDIQRERLSEQFQRQSAFLKALIDAMPFPIFYKDVQLRYLGCNTRFEQFAGVKRERIIGKTAYDIWPEELADIYDRGGRELMTSSNSQALIIEGSLQTVGDVRHDVLIHQAAFRNQDGSLGGIIGAIEDITERKRAEEDRFRMEAQLAQTRKMEALGTLAGGIAHDFNNILSIIAGFSELSKAYVAEGSLLQENLEHVLSAVNRAKGLVHQILAFSRRGGVERQPVEMESITKETLTMLRATLPSTIEIRELVNSEAVIMADLSQINQVLINLCTNAAHAMKDAGGVLEVWVADVFFGPESTLPDSSMKPGLYVKLTVSDTGNGIDPAILPRIFDPFFSTKGRDVGTGLGLAVVHGIVKSYDGAIVVNSTPGKGTTVQVLLPAREKTQEPVTTESVPSPQGRERVLVVDDEPELAMVAKKLLENLGYEVDCRTNSIEALETFRLQLTERPFDLVITDMTMPYLTGEDLAKTLLGLQPDLPIIMYTGFNDKMDAEKAKILGIKGFLHKPLVIGELAGMIRELLDKRTK
jgi:PAS domain S-box-containing protein